MSIVKKIIDYFDVNQNYSDKSKYPYRVWRCTHCNYMFMCDDEFRYCPSCGDDRTLIDGTKIVVDTWDDEV